MPLKNDELYSITVKTFEGLEQVLCEELADLGLKEPKPVKRAVLVRGTLKDIYRINFWTRTGLAVLAELTSFKAQNEEELYDAAREFEWESVIPKGRTIAMFGSVYSSHFRHSKFPLLKVKDAVVDRLRDVYGVRPDVDRERPDFQINVRISENQVNLALDSSGAPLFKRGYRTGTNLAPLNEILAAGMLKIAGWKGDQNFVDPMCGSGTLPTEAALMAWKIPPAFNRRRFGFMNWKNFDKGAWHEVSQWEPEKPSSDCRIYGSDSDIRVIRKARRNLEELPEGVNIRLQISDIREIIVPDAPGIAIMNPPYGERLRPHQLDKLYGDIGTALKHKFMDYDCWIISPNQDAMKSIGLKPSEKHRLFNGKLECTYRKYQVFSGTMKEHKTGKK